MRVEIQKFVFKFIIDLSKPLFVIFKVLCNGLVVDPADKALLQEDFEIILLLDEVLL